MSESAPARPLPALPQRLLLALLVALGVGLAEGVYAVAGPRLLERAPQMGPDAWWLAPLADLAFVGLPAALGAAAAGALPERRQRGAMVAALAFPAWLAVVVLFNVVSLWSAIMLAAGLAAVTARVEPRLPLPGRRAMPWLAGGALAAVGLLLAIAVVRMRPGSGAGGTVAASGRLNVLLLIIDTGRAANFSVYGYARATSPVLERLGQRGVVFENAIAPSSWTLQSHASLFTGRNALQTGADWWTPLDARYPTIAERFRDAGYATGGFVANVDYCGPEFGLDRGFGHYEAILPSPGEAVLSTSLGRALVSSRRVRQILRYHNFPGRKTAEDINRRFLAWVDGLDGRPFFAFLNVFDVHQPVLPPAPYDEQFGPRTERRPDLLVRSEQHPRTAWFAPHGSLPPRVISAEIEGYDGAIRYVDAQLESLISALEQRGLLERTIVVVTSDHGEQFGEHGLFDHGNSLFQQEIHVPLLILAPGSGAVGRRIRHFVSLRHLPATMVELAGVPALPDWEGRSLARFWGTPDERHEPVVSQLRLTDRTEMTAIIEGGLKYVRHSAGEELLFDLGSDPAERYNLLADSTAATALVRLRSLADSVARADAR